MKNLLLMKKNKEHMEPEIDSKTISNIWNSPSYVHSRHYSYDVDQMESNKCICLFTESGISENYTQLRTQVLLRARGKGMNTIMITSPVPNTGKTITAINLSLALAKTCTDTVLLVDCDLKKQTICKYMGIHSEKGLVDILLNGDSVDQVMIWPGIEKMTIISGGASMTRSSELLGSPQMASLMSEMKTRYADRFVLLDFPSIHQASDVMTFAQLVDCILIVVEDGKCTTKEIQNTVAKLPRDKILGFVYNKKK